MTKNRIRRIKWLAIAALSCFAAAQAHAQATRTWVSGVGDDVNPCSRTAPCKTFAGAISKTAAGGEISVLDPGGFGAVTITKSITLNGEGTLPGILAAGTHGVIVNAGSSDVVTLRNIGIHGAGTGINGIHFINGGTLHVERVYISGFSGRGINFAPPTGGSKLLVTDTWIHDNGGTGVHIAPTGAGTVFATLRGVNLFRNAPGLRAEDGSTVVVHNSAASENGGNGFIATGTSRAVEMTLESCVSFHNAAGGVFSGPLSTVRIHSTSVTNNGTGLAVVGGQIVSHGNNMVSGNGTNGAPTSTPGPI